MGAYAGLFAAAFLAATVVPVASEVAVVGLLATGREPLAVWVVATAGNTLGATVNWALGRGLEHFRDRRWFPVRARELERAQRWFSRYGVWSLLLAWVPVVGDPLTFAAGLMRVPLALFVVLVAAGKGARYAAVVAGVGLAG